MSKKSYSTEKSKKEMLHGGARKNKIGLLVFFIATALIFIVPYVFAFKKDSGDKFQRAIINEPPIIIADEPTGNLDSSTGEDIIAVLIELNRKGRTVIIVTHDEKIASVTKKIISLKDGFLSF